jgi:hypothetical protein
MQRAGRFLWLDWSQARTLESNNRSVTAEHDGYRRLGFVHRRKLEKRSENQWEITDDLLLDGKGDKTHEYLLHWLLPDWPFKSLSNRVELKTPFGLVEIETKLTGMAGTLNLSLIRAGETLSGDYQSPVLGWFSPTYNQKIPALSLIYQAYSPAPAILITGISFLD